VRKGVGTYEEFASTIGRSIPSAQRAGQSVESLAGMLAFLTRNGLSAAMASASAGRAFDAFSNPKVVQRLEAMGVVMRDANGEFRDIGGVMADLQQKLGDLSAPDRAATLADIFAGAGGTIQARRFFDLVLKDGESVKQFQGLVEDMKNAAGEFQESYETMANTTVNKTQVLKNNWELFRIEVGEAVTPILIKLMEVVMNLLQWWNGLDESTRKTIIMAGLVTTGLTILVGVVLTLAGAFLLLTGAAAALGITVTALLGWVALIVIAIAAVVAAVIWCWKNWDQITAWISGAWEWLWGKIVEIGQAIGDFFVGIWDWIYNKVETAVNAVVDAVKWLGDMFVGIWDWIWQKGETAVNAIVTAALWLRDTFVGVWNWIWEKVSPIIAFIVEALKWAGAIILTVLVAPFVIAFNILWGIIKEFGEKFAEIWNWLYTNVIQPVSILIGHALDMLGKAWDAVWAAHIQPMIDNVVEAWNWCGRAIEVIGNWIQQQLILLGIAWDTLWAVAIQPIIDNIIKAWNWCGEAIQAVGRWIGEALNWLGNAWNIFWEIFVQPVIDNIIKAWNWCGEAIAAVGRWIQEQLTLLGLAWDIMWAMFIRPIIDNIVGAWDFLGKAIEFGVDWAGRKLDELGNFFKLLWELYIKPVVDNIVGAWDWLKNALGIAWDEITRRAKEPINFIIDAVWNNGIRAVWNKIAGALGLPELGVVNLIGQAPTGGGGGPMKAMAKGGVLPGYSPGIDNTLVAMSGGEGILVPEAVRGLGAGFVYWANNFFSNGRAGKTGSKDGVGFADGGIVDNVLGFIGGIGSDIANLFKGPVDWIVNKVGDNKFVRHAAAMPAKIIDSVVDKVWSWFTSSGGGGGQAMGWQQMWDIVRGQFKDATLTSAKRNTPDYHGAGTAIDVAWAMDPFGKNRMLQLNQWLATNYRNSAELIHTPGINLKNGQPFDYNATTDAAHYNHVHWATADTGMRGVIATAGASPFLATWIRAGMKHAGVPDSWFGPLQNLIMRESGGNPRAINEWDSNWRRGDPSRGLMQTIGETFNRFRDPRLSADIYDPIANIVAGIRYILATYGSIFNVQQAVGATPLGYDIGGVMPPGLGTYYNGTGVNEYVLTQHQWQIADRAIQMAERKSYSDYDFGGGGRVTVNYVTIYVTTSGSDPKGLANALGREWDKGVEAS
jgi:hypothetical protein